MIRVEVQADSTLAEFHRKVLLISDRRVPNRQLGVQLFGWVMRNFQQSGGMQNPPWAPLKESTAKRKQRKGYSLQPLIRTGHLRQSFRPFSDNDQAGVGSEVPYSEYHEQGGENLPKRSMLPPREVALGYATQIYDLFLQRVTK